MQKSLEKEIYRIEQRIVFIATHKDNDEYSDTDRLLFQREVEVLGEVHVNLTQIKAMKQ